MTACPEPDLGQARRFLELLDEDAEAFTFQSFDDAALARGHLARVVHGSLDELGSLLLTLNKAGAGVFVTINETDLQGRRAENIKRGRAAFADLDGAALEPVFACKLTPHIVVESSPGKYHCYWLSDGLPLQRFEQIQASIAARFNGDPKVKDLPRVMRLPGFVHQKAEPFGTRIVEVNEGLPYPAEHLLAEFPPGGPDHTNGHSATDPEVWRKIIGEGVEEGQRNAALARVAGLLFRRLDAKVAAELAACWNAVKCRPPLPPHELKRTLDSIAARELRRRETS